MKLIIDANIVFSAILNTNGKIADLLLNSNDKLSFLAPSFLRSEIRKHHSKISKVSKLKPSEILDLEFLLFNKIIFMSEEILDDWAWERAFELTKDIDEKDTPYVAFGLFFECKIWTGDKKLLSGLSKKGFDEIILTNDLYAIVNEMKF